MCNKKLARFLHDVFLFEEVVYSFYLYFKVHLLLSILQCVVDRKLSKIGRSNVPIKILFS
jgi:hypothetical protein